jgi:hypothetical protein
MAEIVKAPSCDQLAKLGGPDGADKLGRLFPRDAAGSAVLEASIRSKAP